MESSGDGAYREYVRRQVHELTRTLTRVMFGDFECGASTTQPDELFGYLASMINVSINRARNAQERLLANNVELESQNSLFEAILEGASEIVFLKDRDRRYRLINRAGRDFFGLPADMIIGKLDEELLPSSPVASRDQRVMTTNQSETYETTIDLSRIPKQQATGVRHYLCTKVPHRDAQGEVIGVIGFCRDITSRVEAERERADLENQLRHAQKMEAVGQLAGGIAHDFNNLLTAVLGNAELLLEDITAPNLRDVTQQIIGAGERAAELTEQLLTFSRKRINTPGELDIGQACLSMESMLRRLLGDRITFTVTVAKNGTWVFLDPGQLEQVIINLVLNARDAMPQGGSLSIQTEALNKTQVSLTVNDTGFGMEESIRSRIFEPFFTTKEIGKGTGLGLSTAYGIISDANGRIEVESAPGEGTQFTITLPRIAPQKTSRPLLPTVPTLDRSATVLLVDDTPEVRDLARRFLEGHGLHVITATSALDGLRRIRAGEQFDLLITDVVMPDILGTDLASEFLQCSEDVRVLLISGYAPSAPIRELTQRGQVSFLRKPFGPTQLLRAVDSIVRHK